MLFRSDAEFTLMAGELSGLLADLLDVLGGEQKEAQAA